ncbi:GNAT family N-acetyltransferase [Chryseobacterium taihuense]|uniref:Acetyltransferase (GNAT) family protein n=1 Tax=Chryseobacterium taihuense TaxID=1141221 RepID=A0ABY0QTJ9_9FLAO|nr:GNAT family N-acetyltransferase [Chryseobacterium taihuense]SDL85711.1 Acetyltransferase (GNAT) family protein [Chryseobacterium taihuense]
MNIRKADKTDIPFIVNAIVEIESFSGTNTFNNLFGTNTETTKKYLEMFLNDEENFDTEFSLNTYSVVEFDNQRAACCSIFFTDSGYYQSKSELFPIHLEKQHLDEFIKNAKSLPETKKISANKYFLEYLFVAHEFRSKGISKPLIEHLVSQTNRMYLIPLENNHFAIEYYRRLGFKDAEEVKRFPIHMPENPIYPYSHKIMLYRDNKKN